MKRCFVALVATSIAFATVSSLTPVGPVDAGANADVANALSAGDVYVTNQPLPSGHITASDARALQAQVNAASNRQVDEKIAIVATYPGHFKNVQDATSSLQTFLDFSGVLVLVSPKGVGVSSDLLSTSAVNAIARQARPRCAHSYAACAILAGKLAVTRVRATENDAFSNAIKFLALALFGFVLLLGILGFAFMRRKRSGVDQVGVSLPPEHA